MVLANISGGGREWQYCSATDGCSSHRVLVVVQGNNRTVVIVVAALVVASVNGDREKQQNCMF